MRLWEKKTELNRKASRLRWSRTELQGRTSSPPARNVRCQHSSTTRYNPICVWVWRYPHQNPACPPAQQPPCISHWKPLPMRGWMGRHQHTPGQPSAQHCSCSPWAVAEPPALCQKWWEGTGSTKAQPQWPRAQVCQNLGSTHFIPAAPHCKSPCSTLILAASNKESTLLLCRQINKDKRWHIPH